MRISIIIAAAIGLMLALPEAQADERVFGDGQVPWALEEFDLNGDGVISEEEAQVLKEAMRNRHRNWVDLWDTDGDGVISEEERQAAIEGLRQRIEERRQEHFIEADTDGDGQLSLEEFLAIPAVQRLEEVYPGKAEAIFALMDADDDGYVTLEEFIAYLKAKIPVGPVGPQGPPEPPATGE